MVCFYLPWCWGKLSWSQLRLFSLSGVQGTSRLVFSLVERPVLNFHYWSVDGSDSMTIIQQGLLTHMIYIFTVCMQAETHLCLLFSCPLIPDNHALCDIISHYNLTFTFFFCKSSNILRKRQRACEVMLSLSFVAPHESLSAVPE